MQYSAAERELLQGLNVSVPGAIGQLASLFTGSALNSALDGDRGLGVLQPGEGITVTGHSLGGHLALLFGRMFPLVTDAVYTFNAPGILPHGDFVLTNAGAPGFDPARVTNIVANYGVDFTAAIGSRPGATHRVFNEVSVGNATHNHSIVQLSDSLALYDLFGALTPGLATRIDEVSAILAAASAKPQESLERSLDMLRLAISGDAARTPIASSALDQAQRDAYYTRLYELRDEHGGVDWGIQSLVGMPAIRIPNQEGNGRAYQFALAELMPFAVTGADFSAWEHEATFRWYQARADFLSRLIEARTLDQPFVESRSGRSTVFVDVDREERVAALAGQDLAMARSLSGSALAAHLDAVAYAEKALFGSMDDADALVGSQGADRLFGQGGDDLLQALAGNDFLEGGTGADRLEGGTGYDVYSFDVLNPGDRIVDTDGEGHVELNFAALGSGYVRPDGTYATADGAHVYELLGNVLRIDGMLEIAGYQNGHLGIRLSGGPSLDDEAPAAFSAAYTGDFDYGTGTDLYFNPVQTGNPAPDEMDFFHGAAGNTRIETFGGQDDVEERYGGDDLILLGAGYDLAFGGAGNDWIEGGADIDLIAGGRGDDVLHTESAGHALMTPLAPYLSNHRGDQASGGDGEDTLVGSGRADFLEGGAGSDRLFGGAGNDILYGDAQFADNFLQETHDESRTLANGQVVLADVVRTLSDFTLGSNAPPRMVLFTPAALADVAGAAADEIDAGPGDDLVHAGSGDDRVAGGLGADRLFGGAGDDSLRGDDGADDINGEDGNDTLFGGGGNDILRGGAGADVLDGGTGSDTVHAGAGDVVVLSAGGQSDTLQLEADASTVLVRVEDADDLQASSFGTGVTVSLPASLQASISLIGTPGTFAGLQFEFSNGSRTTLGELLARPVSVPENRIATLPPAGGPGNDTLTGGTSAQLLLGGAGDDTYTFNPGDGRDAVDDSAGFDTLRLQGVAVADTSIASSGGDLLLRYPGGEVRLVQQAEAGHGIDRLEFSDATWTRAELAAAAEPLATVPLLDVAVANPGEPFSYAIAESAFGDQYVLGTPRMEVGALGGPALPAWLSFDAATRTLAGTPAAGDAGVVPLLIGMRDGADMVAVTPLVISVGNFTPAAAEAPPASAEPVLVSQAVEEAAPAASADNPIVDLPVLAPAAATSQSDEASESTVLEIAAVAPPAALSERPSVGKIDDPVYERVESLLSAPASTHATSFVARYAEAIREFNQRSAESSEDAPPPPPTDDEMAAYNAALHAWLDEDRRRMSSGSGEDGWDFGGWVSGLAAGSGSSAPLGVPDQALARPGLAQRAIHATPGLSEGVANLTL